ncbi:MAG: hypothetical protein M3444_00675, partial [Acidobacteriota bacterium]|nr:hypothetical protein [Acidobacteriota bacterium]
MAEEKWRGISSTDKLFGLAYTIARRDFLDLVKDKEYRQTLITDSIDVKQGESLMASISGTKDVLNAAEASALVKSLEPILDGDAMVKAYLYLWLQKDIGKREDIAYVLGVSEREATDIRRRLLYKVRRSLAANLLRGYQIKADQGFVHVGREGFAGRGAVGGTPPDAARPRAGAGRGRGRGGAGDARRRPCGG